MGSIIKKRIALISGAAAASLASAFSQAALDTAVTTQFSTVTADITELGVLLVGLAAVVMGIRWLKAMFF